MAGLALLLLNSCVKNEFQVDFAFSPDVWGNYTVDYYASSDKTGMWMQTTVPLQQGKYTLRGVTRHPTVVYVSRGAGSMPEVVLYATRGDRLVLSGESSDPLEWRLEKGNSTSRELTDWRLANVKALRSAIPDSVNAAVGRLVRSAPDSRATAIILLTYYDRRADADGFAYLWNALQPKAEREKMAEACGVADLAGDAAYSPKGGDGDVRRAGSNVLLRSMVVAVPGGKRRLLSTASKDASIFYFGRNGAAGRDADIDTLRALGRQWGDSARRLIVSVGLETDSVGWINALRFDSLRLVAHAWMPLAQADTRLRTLGVEGPGWWIVADSTGRTLYSGRQASRAAQAFRTLMRRSAPRKDSIGGKANATGKDTIKGKG